MSNEELAVLAALGDTQAQEQLFKQNEGIVVRVCRSLVDDVTPMDDLKQEAFIAMIKAVKHYDPNRGIKFISFFVTALKRHLWRFKKYNRLNADSLDEVIPGTEDIKLIDSIKDDSLPDMNESVEIAALRSYIDTALSQLPTAQTWIIKKHYYFNDALTDIARAMNQAINIVYAHHKKGLKTLRRNVNLLKVWREYEDQELDSRAMRGGYRAFREHEFTSITESLAMQLFEHKLPWENKKLPWE